MKILFVDYAGLSKAMGEEFEDQGWEMDATDSDAEALQYAKDNDYDALVIEPWREGDMLDPLRFKSERISLIRDMKRRGAVVVLTTDLSKDALEHYYELGEIDYSHYIKKTYNPFDLVKVLGGDVGGLETRLE